MENAKLAILNMAIIPYEAQVRRAGGEAMLLEKLTVEFFPLLALGHYDVACFVHCSKKSKTSDSGANE